MKNVKLFLSVLWGEVKEPIVALIVILFGLFIVASIAFGLLYSYEEFGWFTSLVDWGLSGLFVLILIILIVASIEWLTSVYKKYKRLK